MTINQQFVLAMTSFHIHGLAFIELVLSYSGVKFAVQ